MGFLREYGIIIIIISTLCAVGYIWHLRGNYDSNKTVAETEKTVEPIQQKEFQIGAHPLSGSDILMQLQRHKY